METRIIPITTISVDDRGTEDTSDDVFVEHVEYRIEVYNDGYDATAAAAPDEVFMSRDEILDEEDLEVEDPTSLEQDSVLVLDEQAQAVIGDDLVAQLDPDGTNPAIAETVRQFVQGPEFAASVAPGLVDLSADAAANILHALPPEAIQGLAPLFETLLANAYPGSPSLQAAIEPEVRDAMPGAVAAGLADAIARGDVPLDYALSLVGTAADRDPNAAFPTADPSQNDAARASAALFAVAFKHLDGDPEAWIDTTGFDFLGGFGGNCANFLAVGYLYAGFAEFGEFTVASGVMRFEGPPVPDGSARGAIGLAQLFQSRGSQVTDPLELQAGDMVMSDGDPHVSMIVGLQDSNFDPPRWFASQEEALEYYQDQELDGAPNLTVYVADHDASNPSAAARPMDQVFSGGDWKFVDIGNPLSDPADG